MAPIRAAGEHAARRRHGPLALRQENARSYFTDLPVIAQDGKERRFFSDILKDKVVLIYLFFTNCENTCPVINQKLANVQDLLGDRLGTDITLISITTDPARDTPSEVKKYSEYFEPRPGWLFLSGEKQNIETIVRRLGHTSSDPTAACDVPDGRQCRQGEVDEAEADGLGGGNRARRSASWPMIAKDSAVWRCHLPAAIGLAVGGLLTAAWAGDFTPEEQRGRQLYREGVAADGTSLTATLGQGSLTLPATKVPCASCHGPDGLGRPEAGVVPSNITWANLTKPYGLRHDNGRSHPPYTADAIIRAVTSRRRSRRQCARSGHAALHAR